MHRTPPGEDKPRSEARTHASSSRYQRPSRSQRTPEHVYSDEHPEIPKIRRASLRLDETQLPPVTPRSAPVTRRSARLQPPNQEAYGDDDEQPSMHTTGRIMVSQRRRRTIYEPPPATYHRSRPRKKSTHKPRTFYTQLQELSHNRTLMIVLLLLLVGCIILPVGVTIIVHSHTATPDTSATQVAGPSPGTPSTIGQVPLDPHELVITPSNLDHPAPPVLATAAYLLDATTGATLYARNPFMHLPVMSTTKLMTAVLAAEKGRPDQLVTITPAIAHDISQLSADSALFGVKPNESYTLRDLLYGMLLASGNDAAIAVADTIGGNLPHFADMMNARAVQLGMHDTHYINPHGLLATGQFSSAHDMALLGSYSLGLPLIHQISSVTQYTLSATGNHPVRPVLNGDQFLWWYPGVDGGKTGWDGAKNYVQVISCVRNQHRLIGVVIHTNDWWTDMRNLMNWGFDTYTWISPREIDTQRLVIYDNLWNYFASDKQTNSIPTADHGRYYISTGYSISHPILSYFDQGGGLQKFGYPTGLTSMAGNTAISQQFEHATIRCDLGSQQCTTV